jgi:hypothetical protein
MRMYNLFFPRRERTSLCSYGMHPTGHRGKGRPVTCVHGRPHIHVGHALLALQWQGPHAPLARILWTETTTRHGKSDMGTHHAMPRQGQRAQAQRPIHTQKASIGSSVHGTSASALSYVHCYPVKSSRSPDHGPVIVLLCMRVWLVLARSGCHCCPFHGASSARD